MADMVATKLIMEFPLNEIEPHLEVTKSRFLTGVIESYSVSPGKEHDTVRIEEVYEHS